MKIDETLVFYVEVYFYMDSEAPLVTMLPDVSKKNNFLEILALLHHVSFTNEFGFLSKLVCEADIVQKCEDFKNFF